MKRLLFIFGTRPEAIKMAPLIKAFKAERHLFETEICVTAQHREMLDSVLEFFNMKPDYDLNLMKPNQDLFSLTASVIANVKSIIEDIRPDNIWVQGDTTTVMASAIAAYYSKIKISHLEAGLRSGDKFSPFPEEMNRILTSHLADYHFTPTERALKNLKEEGINQNVWLVGNTVIDALYWGMDIIKKRGEDEYIKYFDFLDLNKRILLVTGHRRESFGKPFEQICEAIREIATSYSDIEIVYPVHFNPRVRGPVNKILSGISNVHLIEPIDYSKLIWLMNKSYLVLTDSGGIQEEAPSLGKPVLVMRNVTERVEGIEANTARLVGTEKNRIVNECVLLLENREEYLHMANSSNPYGDGKSSRRIVEIYKKELKW